MALQRAVTPPRTRSIPGTNPYSKVHTGASITPSRLMNSWTWMAPIPFPPRCSREILNYNSIRHGAVDELHAGLRQLHAGFSIDAHHLSANVVRHCRAASLTARDWSGASPDNGRFPVRPFSLTPSAGR